MSEHRYQAHWVQNILHDRKIKFSLNNTTFEGNARIVIKDGNVQLVNEVQ
jgi:hypothetical protein